MPDKIHQIDLERAWKDQEYRKSLTPEQLKELPPNPAGDIELNEADLENVVGGGKVTSSACNNTTIRFFDKASPV